MVKRVILLAAALGVVGSPAFAQDKTKKQSREETISKALDGLEVSKPTKVRKMLVFSLTKGFRHGSIPTGKTCMTLMGKKTGAFEAVISDDLIHFEPENISKFDAICFLNTTQSVFSLSKKELKGLSDDDKKRAAKREARLKKSLMDFIKSGKGFVGIHAASDTFYEWPEYGRMIGGYFDGHPWRSNTPVSVKVEDGEEKHACCAHFEGKNLNFKEEIYQFKAPYDPKKLHMLLRLDPEQTDISIGKRKDNDYGVSWIKHHGQGRVFYCSLGHNHHIYENPKVLQHYLKGIQWALGDINVEVKPGN
ncbi:MAG: ThuA domain-containing protein [Akkermansiaceae bacterium]